MLREALSLQLLEKLSPREAAALFVARRAEGLTAHEEGLLAGWLARDPSHQSMLSSAERAWASVEGGEDDELLKAMRERAREPRRERSGWRFAAVGGALAAALATIVILLPGLNPWRPAAAPFQYATARGEVEEITLADGSVITLDADSEVSGLFTGSERSLRLHRGRALFAVAQDASRAFVVSVGTREVAALGTRFDVNLIGDDLAVTLIEGRVSIGAQNASPVALEAGQQYLARDGTVTVRTLGSASAAIGWLQGLISFDDQPLEEAVAIMNRYSEEQIALRDPSLAGIRVSGQFRAGETRRFAETLAEIHALGLIEHQSELELVRAE